MKPLPLFTRITAQAGVPRKAARRCAGALAGESLALDRNDGRIRKMLQRAWLVVCLVLFAGAVCADAAPQGPTRLLRYADISKDNVVFAYAGDLWISPRSGGSARRLTTYPGDELFPKFSPDGKWIAFTGEYDGNLDVYVIPS